MRILHYAIAAALSVSAVSIVGCSSNSSGTPAAPVSTVSTALAAQSATISIADPAGLAPVATVTTITDSLIGLTAKVTTPGVGGAGTIDIVISGTNNAERAITNFKAVVDTAGSTFGTATISGSSGVVQNNVAATNNGENYVYLGEPLVTPPGKTVENVDDLRITLNVTPADPLVIQLNLPTEDVALIGTDDYSGEDEIESYDTGVGGERTVGHTQFYEYANEAANATEGFLSADGRTAYLGHKTNPYVLILDTHTGTVDAVALLDPPETENPSGTLTRVASVDSVVSSPDGKFLYANVLDGAHPYDASGCADNDADGLIVKNLIMKVEISTMEVVGELDVTGSLPRTCDDHAVLKRLSMSSDGSVGAAALFNAGRVVLVNLNNMTLIKSLLVNDIANDKDEPHYTAVSPDGSKVYVAYNGNDEGSLDVIDTTDFSMTELAISVPGSDDAADLRFGPDDRLYYSRRDGTNPLFIFDLSTDPVTEVAIDGATDTNSRYSYGRIAFSPYGDYYYFTDYSNTLYKFGMSDDTLSADSPLDMDGTLYHLALPTMY